MHTFQPTATTAFVQLAELSVNMHMFGLTSPKKYGGMYVPPHQAVIHQFAKRDACRRREDDLGSDSHTRYGALGTMAMGEG